MNLDKIFNELKTWKVEISILLLCVISISLLIYGYNTNKPKKDNSKEIEFLLDRCVELTYKTLSQQDEINDYVTRLNYYENRQALLYLTGFYRGYNHQFHYDGIRGFYYHYDELLNKWSNYIFVYHAEDVSETSTNFLRSFQMVGNWFKSNDSKLRK